MVAISLYRGNLHKVPDVPRRWLMPTPKISLKDFKVLLHRRSRALARLQSTTASTSTATATAIGTTSAPDPNPTLNPDSKPDEDEKRYDSCGTDPQPSQSKEPEVEESEAGVLKEGCVKVEVEEEKRSENGGDFSVKPVVDGLETVAEDKHVISEDKFNPVETITDVAPVNSNPNPETSGGGDALTDKEKRKKEVEEKLQILNAKKHNFVQMLKQILNAEEELKRRNSMQGMGARPSVPLQVDVTNDNGSMTRYITPRTGSEGNLGVDMDGGEADDISNHNMHSRHLIRMSSTSPSSDSPHRRPSYHVVLHPSRAASTVAGSPSRFAPIGQQAHPANLSTVSVSGNNFIASSPSPAASGGTSVFRDGQHPSPWN